MSQYYKKYMKKREEEKPSYAKLFVGAFLLMMVFFVIVATHLTSSVDTSIGENDEGDIKESGLGVKHLIDSRLRFIQMEDNSGVTSTKEKSADIDNYNKTIQEDTKSGYNGNLQNSYGYEQTQETKPLSHTYNNTQSQVSTPVAPVKVATPKPVTVPTPQAVRVSTPTTSTSSYGGSTPSHNIKKNLTPTGMN